jgi:molecular chaperone GrpE (heat shock protein)
MKWEVIEDRVCCLIFLKNHHFNRSNMSISKKEALFYGVNKNESSIRMKFQNCASLCIENEIKLTKTHKELDNVSKQLIQEFNKVKDYTFEKILQELHNIKTDLNNYRS